MTEFEIALLALKLQIISIEILLLVLTPIITLTLR